MSETSDIAEIANNPRLSPNKKLLIMEQLNLDPPTKYSRRSECHSDPVVAVRA